MNYNNFRMVGKRLNFLSLKRRLHDSKLPFITSSYRNPEGCRVDWCGKSTKSRCLLAINISKYRKQCRSTT